MRSSFRILIFPATQSGAALSGYFFDDAPYTPGARLCTAVLARGACPYWYFGVNCYRVIVDYRAVNEPKSFAALARAVRDPCSYLPAQLSTETIETWSLDENDIRIYRRYVEEAWTRLQCSQGRPPTIKILVADLSDSSQVWYSVEGLREISIEE